MARAEGGVLPLEQQPCESDKACASFKTYRELGPERSLAVAADKLRKSKRMMGKWSHKFDWPARMHAHAARLADMLKVDADEEGVGGADAADAFRYLAPKKARTVTERKLEGVVSERNLDSTGALWPHSVGAEPPGDFSVFSGNRMRFVRVAEFLPVGMVIATSRRTPWTRIKTQFVFF